MFILVGKRHLYWHIVLKKYNGEDNCHQINNLQVNIILSPTMLEFNLLLTNTFPCLTPI